MRDDPLRKTLFAIRMEKGTAQNIRGFAVIFIGLVIFFGTFAALKIASCYFDNELASVAACLVPRYKGDP